MSRGLGRWQRLLLHELYHNARPPSGFFEYEPNIRVHHFTTNESEDSAARRAARGLIKRGLARPCPINGQAYQLFRVIPPPDVACTECGRKCSELGTALHNSEHLTEPALRQ